MTKQKKFHDLQAKWKGCISCDLYQGRSNIVHLRGELSPDLVFVGEAPGADEDREGKPFVGRAGGLLDKLIVAAEIDSYAIVNCVACRPPDNRNPQPKEFTACSSRLFSLLEILDPNVLILLGSVPYRMLAEGATGGITQNRGEYVSVKISRLGKDLYFPAVPTFHPSYLLRNGGFGGKLTPTVIQDIKKAAYLSSKRQR